MTIVGSGGVVIRAISYTTRFKRDRKKLAHEYRQTLDGKLAALLENPMPSGLCFEKLKGISNPAVYSIHVTGNYKVTFELQGDTAVLRRVACHDEIDRAP